MFFLTHAKITLQVLIDLVNKLSQDEVVAADLSLNRKFGILLKLPFLHEKLVVNVISFYISTLMMSMKSQL